MQSSTEDFDLLKRREGEISLEPTKIVRFNTLSSWYMSMPDDIDIV